MDQLDGFGRRDDYGGYQIFEGKFQILGTARRNEKEGLLKPEYLSGIAGLDRPVARLNS